MKKKRKHHPNSLIVLPPKKTKAERDIAGVEASRRERAFKIRIQSKYKKGSGNDLIG